MKTIIKVPTRKRSSSSTIIEHILANYPKRFTQHGAKDIGLSDHQLIYCTRKISRVKRGSHKQIKPHSPKLYTVDLFKQEISKLNFLNHQNYNDINEAYHDSIQKIMGMIDKVAPRKERRIR